MSIWGHIMGCLCFTNKSFGGLGKDCLKLVREYGQMADYRNHLRVNLCCRRNRIVSKNLQISSSASGINVWRELTPKLCKCS